MEIRSIKKEDIPALARIERACFSKPWSEEQLESSFNADCRFLLCEDGKQELGYCGILISDGGYITNIGVLPQFRGRGIGAALIKKAAELCREQGLEFLSLEVRVSNAPAIALYEKEGFEMLGKRRNFYSDPREDAYIYTLFFKKD